VLSLEQELEYIRWRNRKRRATRAIAIVLIGWLAGLIVGGVIAAIGPVILNYNTNAGVSFIASGVSVFVFFALISIVSAWYEFRLSAFDGPYSDRPGYDYEVDTGQYKTYAPRTTNASKGEKEDNEGSRVCFKCQREYPANVLHCSFCDLWLDPRLNFKS
jgi:hypothetical protein